MRIHCLFLVVCALGLAVPEAAEAAKRNVRVQLNQSFEHDSNLMLSYRHAQAVSGRAFSPKLELSTETPTSALAVALAVTNSIYNKKGYSSTDAHLTGDARTGGETWSASMSARYDYDTTRTSQVNSGDVFVVAGIRHELIALAPSFTKVLSPRDQISFGGSATLSSYEKKSGYQNYNQFSANLTWSRMLDQKNTATLGLQASRYETTTGRSSRVDNLGATIGWQHQFSEKLSGSIQVGAYHKRPQAELYFWEDPVTNSWEMSFDASLRYQTRDFLIETWARRFPNPTASGYETDTTEFGTNNVYAINSKLRTGVDGRYRLYQTPTTGGTYTTTTWSLAPYISYRLTRDLSLSGTYRYSRKTSDAVNNAAVSNMFKLELRYRPRELSIDW